MDDADRTHQKTEWTNSLLEDLCTALRGKRDDATVRGFARELIDDKNLPIGYLVRKVRDDVGDAAADRLDVLIRGRAAVEKEKADKAEKAREEARESGGVRGFMRKLLG